MILQFGCDMFMSQQSKQVQVIYISPYFICIHPTDPTVTLITVIKTLAGESLKVDGNRHLNGMKIDSNALKV